MRVEWWVLRGRACATSMCTQTGCVERAVPRKGDAWNRWFHTGGVCGTSGSIQRRRVERTVLHGRRVWNVGFHAEGTRGIVGSTCCHGERVGGTRGSIRGACVQRAVARRGYTLNCWKMSSNVFQ